MGTWHERMNLPVVGRYAAFCCLIRLIPGKLVHSNSSSMPCGCWYRLYGVLAAVAAKWALHTPKMKRDSRERCACPFQLPPPPAIDSAHFCDERRRVTLTCVPHGHAAISSIACVAAPQPRKHTSTDNTYTTHRAGHAPAFPLHPSFTATIHCPISPALLVCKHHEIYLTSPRPFPPPPTLLLLAAPPGGRSPPKMTVASLPRPL